MQYLILIYGEESKQSEPPSDPAELAAYMAPWMTYNSELKEAGVYLGGNALQNTSTATTIRVAASKPVFTDGPFAETKEQLGGYYLIECDNLDEALAWGAKCPGVHYGSIEVRPLMSFG